MIIKTGSCILDFIQIIISLEVLKKFPSLLKNVSQVIQYPLETAARGIQYILVYDQRVLATL